MGKLRRADNSAAITARLMMNDNLQDEFDEHPNLEKQLILSLDGLHRCGAFFIVVNHLVDASAHGIRAHKRSIARFQQFGDQTHILHPRIEPQIVRVEIKDDWHTVVDNGGHGVWRRGQNRAGFHCVATAVLPPIANPCESE
jgi:hypothetical protein